MAKTDSSLVYPLGGDSAGARMVSAKKGISESSLAEQAYHRVLDLILRGGLGVGAVLSRRKLAKQFHMSLVPVAQAIQRLEIEGLLESRPRAGTRVKVPNSAEVRARFELREALECQSARLCALRATFAERMELKRLAVNVDALFAKVAADGVDSDYRFAVNEYHVGLHMQIAECARSQLLKSEIEKSHALIFNWLCDTAFGRRALPPSFHQDLIAAIVDGKPPGPEETMRAHVNFGLESVQRALGPLNAVNWRVKRSSLAQTNRVE